MLALSSQVSRFAVGNEYLREITIKAPELGVRQSALWAYGFAGDKDVL